MAHCPTLSTPAAIGENVGESKLRWPNVGRLMYGESLMNSGERTKLTTYLSTNIAAVRGSLTTGVVGSPVKKTNYRTIRTLLRSDALKIAGSDANIKEAVKMIEKAQKTLPLIVVQVEDCGPDVDVPKEIKKITDDCAYSTEISGVYVQLDDAQMKHQPKTVPIGTRVAEGEKFGTYATTDWHEENTMAYMAEWAGTLTNMVEGVKVEHGQSKRIHNATAGNVSYEAFCMLLGGKKYVSFHCYPNSK